MTEIGGAFQFRAVVLEIGVVIPQKEKTALVLLSVTREKA